MNGRALTLSLLMAILAVAFVQTYVSSIEAKTQSKFGDEVIVLVANRKINEMETLQAKDFGRRSVPKAFKQPGAIAFESNDPEAQTQTIDNLVGNISVVPMEKGEQITYSKVISPGVRTGLSPQIAPGKRAMSVPVSDQSGVARLIKPGDRVDMIAVIDTGGGKAARYAKTIFQDLGVLAVGKNVSNNPSRKVDIDPNSGKERVINLQDDVNYASVTLEVDPFQAQTLAFLLNNGDNAIILSLRNNDDTERQILPGTALTDLLGIDSTRARVPASAPAPAPGGAAR